MEPDPENVSGEIVRKHSFEHQINWGQVVLGIAVLYVAYQAAKLLDTDESDSGSDIDSDSEADQNLIT